MKPSGFVSTTINVTAIRTNGSPITSQFSLTEWSGQDIDTVINAVMRWTTDSTYGGIVRLFVNIDDREEDGTETLEFNDADGLRLYLQDCDDDKLLSQWSIEK